MSGNISIVLSLISFACLFPAEGYIVDSINGNDNNDGETIDSPFKTISRCAEALMSPGDECQMRAGIYHEVVTLTGIKGMPEMLGFSRSNRKELY